MIQTILESEAYLDYQNSLALLKDRQDVIERIGNMRRETMERYNNGSEDDLLRLSDELNDTYQDILKMPEVNLFLESEAELIRELKQISEDVIGAVQLRIPNM